MKKIFAWYVRTPLVVLNIAAVVLGCVGGLLFWELGGSGYSVTSDWIISVLQPFGNVLIFMLKMIVVPIILCSLVCGAASLPFHQFGKMGDGSHHLVSGDLALCRRLRLFHRAGLQSETRKQFRADRVDDGSGPFHADGGNG